MSDVRIVNADQNKTPTIAATVLPGTRNNPLVVAIANASGDVYNVSGGSSGSGGDGAILDGANAALKATVKQYANSNPLAVVLTNASGDAYNAGNKFPLIQTTAGRIGPSGDGSNAIVNAVAGRKIKVTSYSLQGEQDNSRGHFASGASGSQLTPQWELAAREGVVQAVSPAQGGYLFATGAGSALSLEVSSARPLKYSVTYFTEDAL